MNKIYVVQTWECDEYSDYKFDTSSAFFFSTKEKAMDWVERNNFKVVVFIKNPETDVTLYEGVVDGY